jgi:hypothetical protein
MNGVFERYPVPRVLQTVSKWLVVHAPKARSAHSLKSTNTTRRQKESNRE